MEEIVLLEQLGMSIEDLRQMLANNLNMVVDDLLIEYDEKKKGSFKINGGIPFNKLKDAQSFDIYPPTKSIFYGLPIDESSKELCDRPMGGDICVSTNLYEKYPKKEVADIGAVYLSGLKTNQIGGKGIYCLYG